MHYYRTTGEVYTHSSTGGCRVGDKGGHSPIETNDSSVNDRDVSLHRSSVALRRHGEHSDSKSEDTSKTSDKLHSSDEDDIKSGMSVKD